jgi:4-hydroxybenzoate polyprenyltransferase
MGRAAWALARASHPLPTGAVVALATVLAVALGTGFPTLAILVIAVLSGQLSVGWLNDLVDRHRDRAVGRTDKPVAQGEVSAATVRGSIVAAALLCVPASLALGIGAGAAHLVAVAGAWAYNLRLKFTAWSWAPFALGFGLLPVTVWLAAPAAGLPPWWMVAAAALLGTGAHGANALPDLAGDRATGVAGLPHRLRPATLRLGLVAVLLGALVVLTLGPPGGPGPLAVAALAAAGAMSLVAAGVGARLLPPRAPFVAVVGVAGLAALVLVARGATG